MEHNINELVKRIPKVELHIHLEGAIPVHTLLHLCQKNGNEEEKAYSIEQIQEIMKFTNFAHFLETFLWATKLYKNENDFEEITYDVLKNLSEQNVLHAELIFSVLLHRRNGLEIPKVVEAIIRGGKRATNEFGITYVLIADISRQLRVPFEDLKVVVDQLVCVCFIFIFFYSLFFKTL
jgi:adenosine deaminase